MKDIILLNRKNPVNLKEPLLSIITINLNNLEGLKKTIESVISQSFKNFEYIVIDGGSKDGSKEYIISKEDYINHWISGKDRGIYNAMNKGILKASGKYLLFLNSGDNLIDSEILKKAKNYLQEKDLVYFNLEMYGRSKRFIKAYPSELHFSFFLKDSLPHPSTFIKKELFFNHGFYDETLKVVSDWKFFLEMVCKLNCSYEYVNLCLTEYNLFGVSSSGEFQKVIERERMEVLEENYSAFLEDYKRLKKYEQILLELKTSRKIKLLWKLKMLKSF